MAFRESRTVIELGSGEDRRGDGMMEIPNILVQVWIGNEWITISRYRADEPDCSCGLDPLIENATVGLRIVEEYENEDMPPGLLEIQDASPEAIQKIKKQIKEMDQ